MNIEHRNLLISIWIAFCLASLLTMTPIWQLVLIPGIIAGLFNKSMKYGILSGLVGIEISWLIYTIHGLINRNVYIMLNDLGGLFIGSGYGWLLLLIVLMMGLLLGALGGAIGSGVSMLIKSYYKTSQSRIKESEITNSSE